MKFKILISLLFLMTGYASVAQPLLLLYPNNFTDGVVKMFRDDELTSTIHVTNEGGLSVTACFSNNMVLQRRRKDPIWGMANPGSFVKIDFLGRKYETKADANGKWMVKLDVGEAGGPFVMKIRADQKVLEFNNILIGEVWVCSGQSNMEMPLEGWPNGDGTYRIRTKNHEQEIAAAEYPNIRLLQLETRPEKEAATDIKAVGGIWRECTPKNIRTFSSTAYFFAREVYKKTGIPIGLIESSVGGSVIEAWSDFKPKREHTGDLYNGMIAPIIPYGIRGVLWYQGEFNSGNSWEYQTLLSNMIKDWRNKWGQGDFPFYFMQLPIIGEPGNGVKNSGWVELRDAQFKALSVPNTAMAVSIDLPDNDLHPANKQDFGYRFALIALAKLYDRKNTYVGPLYQSYKIKGNTIRITFSNHEGGLQARNNEEIKGFFIAGRDSVFYEGTARIEGDTIVVSSGKVISPISVRYAWSDNPINNLVNNDGLPASPFRTDDWEWVTKDKK